MNDKIKKELFYFSTSDLLVRVEYNLTQNTCIYVSHRDIDHDLDEMVKKYIYTHILKEQDIFEKAVIIKWLGIDEQLKQKYKFHYKTLIAKNTMKNNFDAGIRAASAMRGKAECYDFRPEIDDAVNDLINESQKTALFNTIGDLLRDRNENHADTNMYRLTELFKLVAAYNKLVGESQQVKVNSLINNNTKE